MDEVVEVPKAKAMSPASDTDACSLLLTPKLVSSALDEGTDNAREQYQLLVGCLLLGSTLVLHAH